MRTVQHKIPADHFLAIRPPVINAEIRADYDAVRAAVESGVSAGYQKSLQSNFRQWERFCAEIGLDPLLQNIADPVPFLQFFAHRVRTGRCASRGKQVQKRAVEHYVRAVGQTIALLGPNDPCRNAIGDIDFRFVRQLRSYQRADPPQKSQAPPHSSTRQNLRNLHPRRRDTTMHRGHALDCVFLPHAPRRVLHFRLRSRRIPPVPTLRRHLPPQRQGLQRVLNAPR